VLWLVRAGAPWRDLPKEFGHWNSVFQRFRRWAKNGVWKSLFNALVEDPVTGANFRAGGVKDSKV